MKGLFMDILFKNVIIPDASFPGHMRRTDVAVAGDTISDVRTGLDCVADRVIDGSGRMLIPGLVNAHCHSAMTLLRGLGGGLPLKNWLNDAILPAEDRLMPELVYLSSLAAIAEMLAGGITSFSDMYFFCEATAKAAAQSGIRANIARSVVSFDESADVRTDSRVAEALALYREWNGVGGIRVDFSLHAEYTNTPAMIEYIASLAEELDAMLQIHLSETAAEHEKCVAKYNKTPAALFDSLGAVSRRSVFAHGVWLTDGDIDLLARRGATVVHCPRSNLKLGSGVAPLRRLMDAGINLALGTDGAASNNRLSILDEYNLAAILHAGVGGRADVFAPEELLPLLSRGGAISQGREDAGIIAPGMKADLCMLDLSYPAATPCLDASDHLAYTASASQVVMTVVGGRVLYENGEYTTIDIEKLRREFSSAAESFHGRK